MSKQIKKNEIVSTIDISSPNVANYEFTPNVAAVGKFDKTILIYDMKNDKSLFSLKVLQKNNLINFFRRHIWVELLI